MRTLNPLFALAALVALVAAGGSFAQEQEPAENPYRAALEPAGFEAQAVVAPAVAPPGEAVREGPRLGVEIRVQLTDYLPRGLEPVLVIGGEPVEAPVRVVSVEGNVTTVAFLVDDAAALREGASLAVQMGDEESTRAAVPAPLRLGEIKQLENAEAARSLALPDLETWLKDAGEEDPE